MEVTEQLSFSFGSFRGGELLQVERGTHAYVGSAMGRNGSASLTRRLLRHATRSAGKPAHPIRDELLDAFRRHSQNSACSLTLPAGKRLHWHVDYLLDQPTVDLTDVLAVRCTARLETALADLLLADPNVRPVALGLGASDAPGKTHLLKTPANAQWWHALASRVFLLAQVRLTGLDEVCVGERL
jgi:Uri superfamily endonuclease